MALSTSAAGSRGVTFNLLLSLVLALMIAIATFANAVTWRDYEKRLTTYIDFDGIPAVIQTSDGAIWVFWSRKEAANYDIFYVRSLDYGDTWSVETPLTVNSSANTGVSVMQASDDVIWLVWSSDRTGNFDIYYTTSSDLGASWSNDTQLTFHLSRDLKPAICQLSNGTIWLVWSSDRTGDYDLYLKTSSDKGTSWSGDIRLTVDPEVDKTPSILQASDGVVWLVWSSDRTGNFDIYYKVYNGSVWSGEIGLTSGPDVDTTPYILQTFDGKIWIFWSSRQPSQTANDDVYYMYSSDNGVTWSGAIQFTTDPYDDMWPSATQTRDTGIWVVWTSDRADQPDWGNWDIYYKTSLVGDINEDGVVDIFDLSILAMAFGSFEGEPEYNSDADINKDGVVDMRDLALVTRNFGET